MNRTTWEYFELLVHDRASLISVLNKQGEEGWELVAVTPEACAVRYRTFFFKRLLEEASTTPVKEELNQANTHWRNGFNEGAEAACALVEKTIGTPSIIYGLIRALKKEVP